VLHDRFHRIQRVSRRKVHVGHQPADTNEFTAPNFFAPLPQMPKPRMGKHRRINFRRINAGHK